MTEAYPLSWPLGRERTSSYSRKPAPFKTTMGAARDGLLKQLKMLGASDVVISSNVNTYKRAGQEIMYADQSAAKEDPGVAVYYMWKKDQYTLACDRYKEVTHNLQALHKTVEAIRGIERWGTGEMMKAAFAGFKALPAAVTKPNMWIVLGISPTKSEHAIKDAYYRKAAFTHPDKGGTAALFQELQDAYVAAMNYTRQ